MPPRRKPVASPSRPVTSEQSSGHLLAMFLKYLTAECGAAENTQKAYRRDLSQFLAWLEDKLPSGPAGLTLPILSSYLQHLHEQSLAATSIARKLASLKMFFRFLVLEGILTQSLADLLASPKLGVYLPRVLSTEMVNRLLAAPVGADRYPLRDRAILAVLYSTGCRVSELANLKLSDVALDAGFCKCLGKGNKERLVALNPVAQAALEAYLTHERSAIVLNREATALFVSRSGRALTRIMLWKLVKRYARRVGASAGISPHTLRHSFATHMLAGGAEIRALQELLGHANIQTTQIYTHVEHSRLKAIHEKSHPRG